MVQNPGLDADTFCRASDREGNTMANEKTHTEKGGKTRRAKRHIIKQAAKKARRAAGKKAAA